MPRHAPPIATLLAALLAGPAFAQDAPRTDLQGWRGQVTAYAWMTGVSGTVRPRAGLPAVETSKSARDVLEDLDAAFFLHGTLRNGRFVLLGDVTWAALSHKATVQPPGLPVPAEVRGKLTQAAVTLAAGVAALESAELTLDLLAGLRLWQVDASVSGEARLAPSFALGAAGGQARMWSDPVLGARLRVQLAPDWSLIAYGDIGGFNTFSRLTWQAVGTLNYRVGERLYASAGYRHMALDYRRDGMVLDVAMSGPILGVTYRF